jgi:hypothetical protein
VNPAVGSVSVSLRGEDGVVREKKWAAGGPDLGSARTVPWRTFRWRHGQQHYSGTYWSSVMSGHVIYESRVHQALTGLGEDDQRRLGVLADWKDGPHLLTYRQAEYTFGLVARVLGKEQPDGLPSPALQAACDDLPGASIPEEFKDASASLAVDWTDLGSFSRPPPHGTGDCAGPEASWGHRKNNLLRSEDELYWGYYCTGGITCLPGS